MGVNLMMAVLETIKKRLNLKRNDAAGKAIGLSNASQYISKPPLTVRGWTSIINKLWNMAYKRGQWAGRHEMTLELMQAARSVYGIRTQKELASVFGVQQPTIGNWERGKSYPKERPITDLLRHRARLRVEPLAEMKAIVPHKRGKTWTITARSDRHSYWKKRLQRKKGIYIFYDSRGSATYVGQSKVCLFTEIQQRLGAEVRDPRFYHELIKSGSGQSQLVQGHVTRMLTVYEILDEGAIHNIEALLIRGLANDLMNKHLENFQY